MKKLYALPIKIAAVIISALLVWCGVSHITSLLVLKQEEPVYCKNAFTQGKNFQLETSEPFYEQAGILAQNLLQYAIFYQNTDNFSNSDLLKKKIRDENESARLLIENTVYLADSQISGNSIFEQYVTDGFIRVEPCSPQEANTVYNGLECRAWVDEEQIKAFYEAMRDESIEMYKMNDEGYRTVCNYINSLDGIAYALIGTQKTVTNLDEADATAQYFDKAQKYAVISRENSKLKATGSVELSKSLDKITAEADSDFKLYIAFENTLAFNDECKGAAEKAAGIYSQIQGHLIAAALFVLGCFGFAAIVVLLAGKKRVGEGTGLSKTDKLPIVLRAVLCIGLTAVSMAVVKSSAQLIADPTLSTSWLRVSPDLPAARIKLCFTLSYLYLLSLLCALKRRAASRKNKSSADK